MTEIELIVEHQLKSAYASGPGSVIETARRVALASCAEQRKLCADAVHLTSGYAPKKEIHNAVLAAGTVSLIQQEG